MFMANLTSEDPIYDEAGPSYDSNTPFEVQDHDTFVDHMDEYQEYTDAKRCYIHNYVVNLMLTKSSDINIILYDRHLKESVETIREIVEEARVVKLLDNALNYACQYTKLSQELLEYVIGNLPKNFNERDNKASSTPIWKPKGKLSDNSLNKTKRVWKATGKLFADIGYQWRPTGKKFTLGKLDCGYQWRPTGKKFALGKMCPLTKLSVKCCSKHMTGNRSKLMNFVEKFIGTVRFGNDHFGAIMGYGDYVIGDNVISSCLPESILAFVSDINGADLLKGSRSTNLYTISIDDMMKSSPICLLSKASKSKSWLWHRRLNHLNFGTINDLARKDLVRGLPRLKFEKDHLCSACQLGKSKKFSHKPKSKNTNMEVLHTLHMDLCGPMRVQSIKGKKYILVIVDDYSRFTWVKFLRSKDETPEFVINFLKQIQVSLNKTVRYIRTDNGTEFINQVMSEYYEDKTPYDLVHDKKPDLTFLRENTSIMEPIHITFDEKHQTMAPGRMSSGPRAYHHDPLDNSNHGSLPTDKELEMLLSTTVDEYLNNLESMNHASASTIDMHHPVRHQGIAEEPTLEDSPITHDVLHPTFNPVTGEPGSAQSSSGNVNLTEPNQVTDHLRKWTKDHPLDNIVGNPSRPVSTRKQLASDALWCCFHTELSKVEPKNFKMAVIEDCWFQAMQDEIHEFDRLEVWELVPRPILCYVIALKWSIKVKLDE
ncbi:retrovirus-related pol polyprotein from transposon TNT 1-94 [Tanacetum coccineum]